MICIKIIRVNTLLHMSLNFVCGGVIMKLEKDDDNRVKEDDVMNAQVMGIERPCTVRESIIQSCKEVKSMRDGKSPLPSLNSLFDNISKWREEVQQEED